MGYIKRFASKIKPGFLVISVALSFALWFMCLNFADPVTYENYSLTLQLLNEDALTVNDRLIENRRELDNIVVDVRVTGKKSELEHLIPDETIYAYVDLDSSELVNVSTTRIGTPISVRISIGFSVDSSFTSYQITSVSQDMVSIVMDRMQERIMTVHVELTGALPAGYKAMDTVQEPRSASVRGPSAIVSKISRLSVEVDLTDARTDIEEELPIRANNAFGEEVTGFDIGVSAVKVKIPVYKTSSVQVIPGDPSYTGNPAKGVAITGVEWEPRSFEIMVHVDEVEQIGQLVLDAYDVTGISQNTTFAEDISKYLQKVYQEQGLDLRLVDEENSQIRVTFITEPLITEEFTISVDTNVHFTGEASLGDRRRQTLTEYVTVRLHGVESVINTIKPEDIGARVDLTTLADFEAGEYELPIVFTPPQGTEIVGEIPSVRIRLSNNESETPPPSGP